MFDHLDLIRALLGILRELLACSATGGGGEGRKEWQEMEA